MDTSTSTPGACVRTANRPKTTRPGTPWLVPVGAASDIEHKEFTLACRGHVQIGKVLGYLIVAASWQEANSGGDVTTCEVVELADITHKKILAQVKISQNSLTTYLKQLATWGYIQADPYRHTYRVYPQKINEAVTTPPPLLEKKPRGKHALPKVLSAESQKYEREQEITKLRKQLTKLGTQFTNLGNRITTLRNKITNLGIENLCEEALEQASMSDSQGRDREDNRRYKEILEDSLVVSASAENDGAGVSSLLSGFSSFEETLQEVRHQEKRRVYEPTNAPVDHPIIRNPLLPDHLFPAEASLEEGQQKAPLDLSPSPKEEVRLEELHVNTLPEQNTNGHTRKVTEPLTQNITIPALLAALSQEDTGRSSSQNKTVGKGKNKKEEETPLCLSRAIREGIDALRGYSLDQGGPLIQQNKIIKQWCQGHTLEEFQAVISHLTTGQCHDEKHQWWRKNGRMRTYFNAAKLADLTPGCLACGCGAAMSPPDSFSCIPEGYNAADEFSEYYGISEKREVEHAAI